MGELARREPAGAVLVDSVARAEQNTGVRTFAVDADRDEIEWVCSDGGVLPGFGHARQRRKRPALDPPS